MWYDNSRILSYNGLLNFVIGNRGGGKSYNAKKWCIKDFLKNNKEFVYVRRYKEELKNITRFFDDIKHEFPKHEFKVIGKKAYIDKKLCGHFITLSTSHHEKSSTFPNVNKIIFDEFIVDSGYIGYIKNEVEAFLDLFETVARSRDNVRALFLGNSISVVNPYFTYFKIRVNLKERFTVCKNGLIIVEMFANQDYINMKYKTKFGQLTHGTRYGNYAINNNFLRDNNVFINHKKPKNCRFMYSIKFDGKLYGFWITQDSSTIYVNTQIDKTSIHKFTLTSDEHEPNFLLIRSIKTSSPIKTLMFAFENGLVMFNNQETKQAVVEIMTMFNSR